MADDDAYLAATDTILDSIADGVFTVDRDWLIRSFNSAAEEITGIPRDEAIGRRCCDVFRASICESSCALRQTLDTGRPIVNKVIYIVDNAGERIPVSISTALLKDNTGRVVGGVETFRDLTALEQLRREVHKRYSFQDIIGKHHRMRELFDLLPSVAESDSTVLIEGESGTGKELVARAIHDLSGRRERPIIPINCGALPDTLLESELFGHKAGAFTDARTDKPGRFAQAEGGTIFLDEIGDVSPALQSRLLRVLQEKTYERLGATESQTADVRIIAATNKDLAALMKKKEFREDLYYRINVIRLTLPTLRERKEDIPLLIDHFIDYFNTLKDREITGVAPDALAVLLDYDYPGNVRELQNIIERAVVLGRGSLIDIRDLPPHLRPSEPEQPQMPTTMDDLERQLIVTTLERCGGNRTRAAAELGMHKTTLWRKMKRLGISS
ncbi:PAS domain-containing protein [candidate division GN15 bacterium]|nr:PAS domain-containing protein [candidate division GN15 bacterium]